MTLSEALETDHSMYVDYIKWHLSIKDGERLEEMIEALKQHAINDNCSKFNQVDRDFDKTI